MQMPFVSEFIDKVASCTSYMQTMPHLQVLNTIPEINSAFVNNSICSNQIIENHFKAVVFNLERGSKIDPLLSYLREHKVLSTADIIFANELDWGMGRTHNRNITEEIATQLQMNYAFGVEFVSTMAGKSGNQEGLHGNAIFSKVPLHDVKIIRLPIAYEWFDSPEPRLGTRMALFATIEIRKQKIGLVCVHLENRTTPQKRLEQFQNVLAEAESHFKDIPVLIGGDLNTNGIDGSDDAQVNFLARNKFEQKKRIDQVAHYEPLIDYAVRHGYHYESCNVSGQSTRRKHLPDSEDILMNLDWFFARQLSGNKPRVIRSIFNSSELLNGSNHQEYDGMELSDHDAIYAEFEWVE